MGSKGLRMGGVDVTEKILFNVVQVLVVMLVSPLVKGVLNRLKGQCSRSAGPASFSLTATSGSFSTRMR
jgi:hypothetical protein